MAGNANSGRKANYQIAPFIRKHFLEAMDIHCDVKGLSPAEIIQAEIEEHGLLKVLELISKFKEIVSESNVNLGGEVTLVSLLDQLSTRHAGDVETPTDEVRH